MVAPWAEISSLSEHHIVAFSVCAGEDGWDVLTAQLDRTPDDTWNAAFHDAIAVDLSYGCPPPQLCGDTIQLRVPEDNHEAGHVAIRVQVTLTNTRLRVRGKSTRRSSLD